MDPGAGGRIGSFQGNCACLMTRPLGRDFSVEVTFQNETFVHTKSSGSPLKQDDLAAMFLTVGLWLGRCCTEV